MVKPEELSADIPVGKPRRKAAEITFWRCSPVNTGIPLRLIAWPQRGKPDLQIRPVAVASSGKWKLFSDAQLQHRCLFRAAGEAG